MAALLRGFRAFEQPDPTPQMVANAEQNLKVPWWRRGGMGLFEHGAILTEFVPALVLQYLLVWRGVVPLSLEWAAAAAFNAVAFAISVPSGDGSIVASILLPLFHLTLALGVFLPDPTTALALASAGMIVKLGPCTSVLHRWAAHGAYKTSHPFGVVLAVLGCLAAQGGPVWWASKHRCHHKFCEKPRDPHSPELRGIVGAFAWFGHEHKYVDLEFRPPHLEGTTFMVIDTFSFVPTFMEYALMYYRFGTTGLWVSYVSGSFCKSGALWFNVANHPPAQARDGTGCRSSDDPWTLSTPNFFFEFVKRATTPATYLVGEAMHRNHHDYPRKAHRPGGFDLPYYFFVVPLEWLGLIWDVQEK